VNLPVREQIGRFKYYNEDDIDGEYKKILENLNSEISGMLTREAD